VSARVLGPQEDPRRPREVGMEWWVWLIVAVVVMVLLVGALLAVQARRRRGGVIVDPTREAGPRERDGRS